MPAWVSIAFIAAGMAPGCLQSRGVRCVMVDCIGFSIMAAHTCLSVPQRVLGVGPSSTPRVRGMVSVLSMHCAIHTLYQCIGAHAQACRGMRKCSRARIDILPPVVWVCVCLVHLLAFQLPSVDTHLVQLPKDTVVVHALMAFVPEALGSVWCLWSSLVCRVLDPATPSPFHYRSHESHPMGGDDDD